VLQDAQDVYLEHQREITISKKIVIIQKMVKGWHQRRKFLLMKKNVVIIQAVWKGYAQRKRYLVSIKYYVINYIIISRWILF